MFNALKYTKDLEKVGLPREQAEAHIQIMTDIMETNLATRQDLQDVRTELRSEIKDLRVELYNVKMYLENKVVQSEHRLTIKLGTIVSIAIGIAVTLAKLV